MRLKNFTVESSSIIIVRSFSNVDVGLLFQPELRMLKVGKLIFFYNLAGCEQMNT